MSWVKVGMSFHTVATSKDYNVEGIFIILFIFSTPPPVEDEQHDNSFDYFLQMISILYVFFAPYAIFDVIIC